MNVFKYKPIEIINGEVDYSFEDYNQDLVKVLEVEFGNRYNEKIFDLISALFISKLNGQEQSEETLIGLTDAFENEINILQAVFMRTLTEQIKHGIPRSTAIKITNGLYQAARKSINGK
ncbi:hypothetical protein [Cytobacillus kochii]